ncbi:hypothetical protein C4J81_06870 [Deltaproteobacteria bacterium Smac51]|nr:hypothetical protein C4J81_06870 [Deltaproteobacteria bacterium Smac51]
MKGPVAAGFLIDKINEALDGKRNCSIKIVNDKLTLSVFSFLSKNLRNVKNINFIIRDTRFLPENKQISHEFEIELNPQEMLFNQYDIIEKNKLCHFSAAKAMYDFIKAHVNVRITRPPHSIRGNLLMVDDDFMLSGSSSLEIAGKAGRNRGIKVDFETASWRNCEPSFMKKSRLRPITRATGKAAIRCVGGKRWTYSKK